MGIIKYFRKKYWEAAIFRGGRRIPFSCDGLTAVPDRAYALFTEKELEKIYNDRNEFYKKLKSLSSVVNDIKYELFTYGDAAEGDIDYTSIFKISLK